ncbi:hypothetical protein J2W83_001004 [Pseudomonas hunanensis]|uniref:Uncharacterized protein n=1 Tax=Pseudomonas hunanensis TaxID=1247546 RepID=A0ACC6JZ16_9PSED|nr:hypothetical protein [Pseudomonas hunanensis]MDR6711410.1 hypothetical protein [Pseudomonas hunanensis]
MELFIVDEHTEYYMTLQAGGETGRGMLSGLGGWLLIGGLGVGVYTFIQNSEPDGLYIMLGICLPMFLAPFLWEALRPLALPIMFNRRTREVYFDHDGELFHTPWDNVIAMATEFPLAGAQIGVLQSASLEVRVWKFERPETALMISLGAPFGKTLAMQTGFWEYIRAYMNNGPYFDGDGNHSESDAFVKSQLAVRFKMSDSFKHTLECISRAKKEAGGRNYLSGSDAVMLVLEPLLYPMHRIHEITYSIAKRRSRNRWPSVVTQRLKANGPTTRLVDLELKVAEGVCNAAFESK